MKYKTREMSDKKWNVTRKCKEHKSGEMKSKNNKRETKSQNYNAKWENEEWKMEKNK